MQTIKQIRRRIDQLDYEIGMTRDSDALTEGEKDAITTIAVVERATLERVLDGGSDDVGDGFFVVRWEDVFNPGVLSTEEHDMFRHCLYRIAEYREHKERDNRPQQTQ